MNEEVEIDLKNTIELCGIGSDHGGLRIAEQDNKRYWAIAHWNGYNWQEIPEYLFNAIKKFEGNSHDKGT